MIDEVEEALDALDEAAFLFNLLPDGAAGADVARRARRSGRGRRGERGPDGAHLRGRVAGAPTDAAQDAVDALQAIDAVTMAERAADDAERRLIAVLMATAPADARLPVLGLELAHALERATDHMGHAALALRDHLLEELSAVTLVTEAPLDEARPAGPLATADFAPLMIGAGPDGPELSPKSPGPRRR